LQGSQGWSSDGWFAIAHGTTPEHRYLVSIDVV
jgi:hypothetical protein